MNPITFLVESYKLLATPRNLFQLRVTFRIYLFWYVTYSFATWDIPNPFQWLIDMPYRTNGQRIWVFVIIFFVECIWIPFCWRAKQKHEEQKSKEEVRENMSMKEDNWKV